MARHFPANVVRTTDRFAAELGQADGVNVEDIVRLWKAYAAQRNVVQDAVVSRLENLFWRIWGSAALQQSLTGIALATLFMAIHENPALARHETKKEPKPILKKSEGKSQPSSFKTTRIVLPEKQRAKDADGRAKPRKKAAFVARGARRGVLIRRKSAQASPTQSPQSPIQSPGEEALEEESKELLPETTELSWQSLSYLKAEDKPAQVRPPTNFSLSSVRHHETTVATNQPLVDQDFRSHFVRKSAQGTASTASSLTTRLSSTNFRELLNAATTTTLSTTTTSPRKSDGRRRPMITRHTQLDESTGVSESLTSTSQHTTSGVFSVPKESREQLSSLIRGKKKN